MIRRGEIWNVSQLVTAGQAFLAQRVGRLPPRLQTAVDEGIRLVLAV